MARKYFLVFNNLSSLRDLDLRIIKRPNIPYPKRRYEVFELQGIDGQEVEDLGTFDDVKIDVEFNFIDRANINIKATKILNWINNINDYKLSFSDDPERYRKVKMIECTDIERQLRVKGSFTVSFICDPFKYYIESSLITIKANNYSIYSNELVYNAKPSVKVYGSGDITLTINNKDIILKGISDHIILNSILMEAYNDNVENLNNKMNGEFPILQAGLNTISWIGNITKIEITPNWRTL